MRNEQDVNGFDVELLRDVLADHGIDLKRAGYIVNRDVSSLSRYLSGERTIPVEIFRALFEQTTDLRLVRLITGRVALQLMFLNPFAPTPQHAVPDRPRPEAQRVPPIEQLLPRTCATLKRCADAVSYVASIVSDRKVDESDAAAVAALRRDATAAIQELSLVIAAIDGHQQNGTPGNNGAHT